MFAAAQAVEISVDVQKQTATVKGLERSPERSNLSFAGVIAGVEGFAERFTDVRVYDDQSREVSVKKMMAGEFLSEKKFASWSYTVDLSPVNGNSAAAHSSWLTASAGVLMMADLLPLHMQINSGVSSIKLDLPGEFSSYSNEKKLSNGLYEAVNIKNAVFYIGSDLNEVKLPGSVQGRLIFSGNWQVSKEDTAAAFTEIYNDYKKLFGTDPDDRSLVAFMRFPVKVNPGEWQAETRGGNITIVSSEMHFPTQSRQRMHEQLRHEIFHLWMPNSLRLTGSYDWFYEGFALYHSLKTGVKLKRISFQDLLNSMGQAMRADSVHQMPISLPEASKGRWKGSNSVIYARGMAVAFLIDLAMLERSRNRSTSDLLQEIFRQHSGNSEPVDGSEAVIKLIRQQTGHADIVDKYILRPDAIEWDKHLKTAGLKAVGSKLVVEEKLNGRQKAILRTLGYNN